MRLARASNLTIPQSYMQIPFGILYASAISILNHIKLLGDSEADIWKRPHNTLTPTPESQAGASEHASTSADDKISLDEVIAKFKATADEDIRAQEILAAATTLRDSTGRNRKDALRKMANAWGVTVNEKVADKYKPRSNAALEKDIQASVCQAALDWESGMERDAEPRRKKTRTTGAAEHGASVAAHPRGTAIQLPDTPDDVMPKHIEPLGSKHVPGNIEIWDDMAGRCRAVEVTATG